MRLIVLTWLLLIAGLEFNVSVYADSEAFLDPDEAFSLSAMLNANSSVKLTWKIADGYSLYKQKFKFVSRTPEIDLTEPALPGGIPKHDTAFGNVEIYRGQLQIDLPFKTSQQQPGPFCLSVTYQGCADHGVCYLPITKEFTFDLSETSVLGTGFSTNLPDFEPLLNQQDKIAELINSQSLWFVFFSFLGIGVLLAFTPCVFPMIPIISGTIINQGCIASAKAFGLSLSYVLASALTYMIFGVMAGLFGSNLQIFFQKPIIIAAFSAVFIFLALSMFGVFSLQIPSFIQTRISNISNRQKNGNWLRAAVMGSLSTLIVGPCLTAPLAGVLIYVGKTGDVLLGGLALFALGLGMGIPLLLMVTSVAGILPKSGVWLDAVKAFLGLGLLAVAVWLLGRILPPMATKFLWGMLLLIPLLYSGRKKLWKTTFSVLAVYTTVFLLGAFRLKELSLIDVLCTAMACEAPDSLSFHHIKTIGEFNQVLMNVQDEARWVMFDLYADWCSTCQEMKQTTFSDIKVKAALANFVLVQADVTDNDFKDKALLEHLKLLGPPSVLFFDSNLQEKRQFRIVGFMNSEHFLQRIALLKQAD